MKKINESVVVFTLFAILHLVLGIVIWLKPSSELPVDKTLLISCCVLLFGVCLYEIKLNIK